MAVTIYDVAKEAGVSIATVSKALNDSYTIPDQTKAAIREIADRLGYRPNARAKNFARQASGTVLFITDFYQNIAFENPHMFEIISGIATYLDGKDYSLTLKPLTKQAAPLYIRDIIQQRQADALTPDALSRQCSNHYAFRAGRNLPDKEFRYLRTVIVTAAVYWGLNSKLRCLTSPLNLPAPGRRQPIYLTSRFRIDLCFC